MREFVGSVDEVNGGKESERRPPLSKSSAAAAQFFASTASSRPAVPIPGIAYAGTNVFSFETFLMMKNAS